MDRLPNEIKSEIISRLPLDSISECKRVCKNWRNLISDACFGRLHLQKSLQLDDLSNKVGLLHLIEFDDPEGLSLYYAPNDENGEISLKFNRINHPLFEPFARFIGSCNGLICFSQHEGKYDCHVASYIYNPITREFLNLPWFAYDRSLGKKKIVGMWNGFGYRPSTHDYKVVRIYFEQSFVGRVQVYTLGGGSGWRDLGEINYQLDDNESLGESSLVDNESIGEPSLGVLVNGALHWVVKGYRILSFDLAKEDFHLLPSPPCYNEDDTFLLKELGGSLCVVHQKDCKFVNVWSWKKNSWSLSEDLSFSLDDDDYGDYEPFALLKCDKLFLWYNGVVLSSYESQKKVLRAIGNYKEDYSIFDRVTHTNSFVSLKSLGEEAKTRGLSDEVESARSHILL